MSFNPWLVAASFLLGALLTYLWSVRRVSSPADLHTARIGTADGAALLVAPDPGPAVEDSSTEPATEPGPADTAPSATDPEEAPWWDRAFVAYRPDEAAVKAELRRVRLGRNAHAAWLGLAASASPGAKPETGPNGERIKGNPSSMLFHTVDSPWYARTKAEVWFASEADAITAGYARWDHGKAKNPHPRTSVVAPAALRSDTRPRARAVRASDPTAALQVGAIKANRESMLYHTTESPWYGRTKAQEWFTSEEAAQAAGYLRWDHKRRPPKK